MSSPDYKFALVDCNNFYASCERVFNPTLENKPIIVLSNNDGCVIARSNESKALGVKMGQPYFKIKDLVNANNIITRSSNYALYGDMSNRVMNIISTYSPIQEIYSIDESFLELSGMTVPLIDSMQELKNEILNSTGIPVCVGLAKTKTLAKLANRIAKKYDVFSGVFDIDKLPKNRFLNLLNGIDIGDIWGIGPASKTKLNKASIITTLDFYNTKDSLINSLLGVNGKRTLNELRGVMCIDLDNQPAMKQQIASTRTFGVDITGFDELNQALTALARKAIDRLNKQVLFTNSITMFATTNPYKRNQPQTTISTTIVLPTSTSEYTLIPLISKYLKTIFKNNFSYHKGGIILSNLSNSYQQQDLFTNSEIEQPLKSMSIINKKYGESIKFASEIGDGTYTPKSDFRSPSFTTKWEDIPIVS